MPFDSASSVTVISPLAKLGITPVSPWVVAAHKDKMLREYLEKPHRLRPHDPGYALWTIQRHLAGWRTIEDLSWRLVEYVATKQTPIFGRLPVLPAALLRIAGIVARKHPRVTFDIAYFNDDPILTVRLDGDGPCDCLGIWDDTGIVEIASYDPPKSWWSRVWYGV